MKSLLLLVVLPVLYGSISYAQTSNYKCMIQMNSYEGEAAYVIISLINPNGSYAKTLAVLGPDKQWYNTLKEWYKYQTKSGEKLSAVTSASVGGGDRAVRTLAIDESRLNKGYKLRFESAVEEKKYHVQDVEIPLTSAAMTERAVGKGYIRFVKLSKVQ
ncbi:DUF2271 domain-containing protein [Sphingobacterium griseoflavum]|uniref:Periplasmic protein, FlgD ig superfamily n=1 Tax=Sphingobacterium griseoflavum TaxID=1474952 RepID=A0ABQ3HX34_9SPHI|nr:DUF2271 domain-containing protein [Sphingobacterium griseoflavum]GHE33212.1 hypothetical protein GCM10017764_15370 [Sphingobacterium griseoflavum]